MTRFSVIIATSLLAAGTGLAQTAASPDMAQPRAATAATAAQDAARNQAPGAQVQGTQAAATQETGQSGEGDCPAPDTVAQPATQPQPGSDSTEANNAGTSGWSGGLGGSHLGTNTQGALNASPTWQPPTARGLDLTGRAEPVAAQPAAC